MNPEIPDPNNSPSREELNRLLRSNSLAGAAARNLMLAVISKGLVEHVHEPADREDPEHGTFDQRLRDEEVTVETGMLAMFSGTERRELIQDIIHDSYAQATIGMAATLCRHMLNEVEIAGIIAATATLFIIIHRQRVVKRKAATKKTSPVSGEEVGIVAPASVEPAPKTQLPKKYRRLSKPTIHEF